MTYKPTESAASQAYLTTANLGAAATFTSPTLNLQGWTQVDTRIRADQDGTITIRWYSDAGATDQVRLITIPYSAVDGFQLFSAPAFTPYNVYEYTNGSVAQGDFFFETKLLHTSLSPQILGASAFIADGMVTQLNRSILVAQNDAGSWTNIKSDNQQHLKVNAANPKTAYDELVVANLSPVSQITFPYNINTAIVDVTEVAGGTATQASNMAVLNTSATTASSAVITSIEQIPYRAGQGHLARFSCMFVGTPNDAAAEMGIGVGDANDGYGFLMNSSGFNVSFRTNGSTTNILQTAWNIDRLDGTGGTLNPSGMTLDETKGNSYQIAYGSGFGTVNFSVESDVSGDYVLVHTLALANTLTVPSVFNPTFPMRAEAVNGAGTDNLTLSVASMASFIEGPNAVPYSQGVLNSQSGTETGTFATEVEIITFFNKADVFGGTGNNKVYCRILGISWLNECNKTAIVRLREEVTGLASGLFTDVDVNTSVVAFRTNGTGTPAGGKTLFEGYGEKDGKGGIFIDLAPLNLIMVPGKKYTITGICTTLATSKDQLATLLWQEDF